MVQVNYVRQLDQHWVFSLRLCQYEALGVNIYVNLLKIWINLNIKRYWFLSSVDHIRLTSNCIILLFGNSKSVPNESCICFFYVNFVDVEILWCSYWNPKPTTDEMSIYLNSITCRMPSLAGGSTCSCFLSTCLALSGINWRMRSAGEAETLRQSGTTGWSRHKSRNVRRSFLSTALRARTVWRTRRAPAPTTRYPVRVGSCVASISVPA